MLATTNRDTDSNSLPSTRTNTKCKSYVYKLFKSIIIMIYQSPRIKKSNHAALFILGGFLVVSVVGISVWFLRQQTITKPQAAPSTTITFNPQSQTISGEQSVSSAIVVDPGQNQ